MNQQTASLDHLSRRLIRDVEEDVRTALGVPHLESDLVSALYLNVREVLAHGTTAADVSLVDELALTLYLTASAWMASEESPVDLLGALHGTINKTLGVFDGKERS